MVVDLVDEAEIDRLFHALADATRRDIVRRVLAGEHSVSGLARRYPMSTTAVQKHVRVLTEAGLVTTRKQGRELLVGGEVTSLQGAQDLLDQLERIWRDRFDRMEVVLAADVMHDPEPLTTHTGGEQA